MFVIPCKFNEKFPFVISLVESIRKYHNDEKIVVVDSDSDNKSYFKDLYQLNVHVMNIQNRNWMIGAYWSAFNAFPDEEFYYFLHDSMNVKGNLDCFKEKELTILMYFDRKIGNFNTWGDKITQESKYEYFFDGLGCYGPMYFCQNKVMSHMKDMGAEKFLPSNKAETGYCEGCYGFFFEEQGFDLKQCSLFGNVLENESPTGKSGTYPFNTSWQFPIEKFYASHLDKGRL